MTGSPRRTGRPTGRNRSDLGRHVAELANALAKCSAEVSSVHDLLPTEMLLLMTCRQMGECTATQLAPVLPVDSSRISRLINGMVDRGFLVRRRTPSDRRLVMLTLSGSGEEVAIDLTQRMEAHYDALTEGLTEEQLRAFAETANAIVANYDATAAE